MSWCFTATENFWNNFYDLPSDQKESERQAWEIFKLNPFDPRLRPHKIHRLSAHYGRTIYAVDIEGDLPRRLLCGGQFRGHGGRGYARHLQGVKR